MDEDVKRKLVEYGRRIKADGWKVGESMISEAEKEWRDFRRWAYALGIMLRAEEMLDQSA